MILCFIYFFPLFYMSSICYIITLQMLSHTYNYKYCFEQKKVYVKVEWVVGAATPHHSDGYIKNKFKPTRI